MTGPCSCITPTELPIPHEGHCCLNEATGNDDVLTCHRAEWEAIYPNMRGGDE